MITLMMFTAVISFLYMSGMGIRSLSDKDPHEAARDLEFSFNPSPTMEMFEMASFFKAASSGAVFLFFCSFIAAMNSETPPHRINSNCRQSPAYIETVL
jgi:hypothetical protein